MYFLGLVKEAAIWMQFTETLKDGCAKRFAERKYQEKLEKIEEWKHEIGFEAQIKNDR